MASAPDPRASWRQRHPICYRALFVAIALAVFPVLIAWAIVSARDPRR